MVLIKVSKLISVFFLGSRFISNNIFEISIDNSGKISNEMRTDMQRGFEDLFNDVKYSELAHDLVKYQFFTNGLNFTPSGFSQFIPVGAYLNNIKDSKGNTISDHLYNLQDSESTFEQTEEFLDQFYRNFYSDPRFVPQIKEESHYSNRISEKGNVVAFEVALDQINPANINTYGESKNAPYVYVNLKNTKKLFKFVGANNIKAKYIAVDTLGKKNYLVELHAGMGGNMQSVLRNNEDSQYQEQVGNIFPAPIDPFIEEDNNLGGNTKAAEEARIARAKTSKVKIISKKEAEERNKKCKG